VTPLDRLGVWSSYPVVGAPADVRAWAREVEALGYSAVWWPEGVECFTIATLLLSWTERLVAAPGIANVYARDPLAMESGAERLEAAFPGRFVLGLGVSHKPAVERRGQDYGPPVPTMRAYLDGMDAAAGEGARPPVLLAALGPLMLRLARERADGAHPYFVPVEHTRLARERLGPGKVLAVEQAVAAEGDERSAREYVERYLSLDNYRNNLERLGLDTSDPDALVPELVAAGVEQGRERVRAHLDAGADHVCVQALPMGSPGLELLRGLAGA